MLEKQPLSDLEQADLTEKLSKLTSQPGSELSVKEAGDEVLGRAVPHMQLIAGALCAGSVLSARCSLPCVVLPAPLITVPTNPLCARAKSVQPCPVLCNAMDWSPPGSSVLGTLQARVLEQAAMPSSSGSSRPRGQTHVSYIFCIGGQVLYHSCHLGKPHKPFTQ